MEGVAEGVGRGAIEEAEVIEAAEGVGVLLAVEEEADGGFAGETVGGELPAAGTAKELKIVVGEFVEAAHERVADAARTEPQEGVEEGVLERGSAVNVGRVISVTLEVDSDGGTDNVVRGLHEGRGLKALLALLANGVEETLGVLDAPKACAADDGVGLLEANLAEGKAREDDGTAQQGAEAAGDEWRDMLRKVRVKAADGRDVAVQDGAVEPVVGEGRLGGDLSGGAYIYRYRHIEGRG